MRGSGIATRLARLAAALAAAAIVVGGGASGARPTVRSASAQPKGEDESAELVTVGRQALQAGKLDAAAKALDQAIALNPRRIEAYALRAAVHAAKGEHERGVALMRRARELAPDSLDVLVALGTQLMLAGQVDEGAPLLEGVVARDPSRYEAHALLGHYYADHEQWAQAVTSLEAYRRSRPAALAGEDDRHALDLAEAYLRTRRASDARTLYAGLAERHPSWTTARMGLAWATAAIDCKAARPLLATLDSGPEAPPEVWLVDGQCALALGDVKDALREAHRYVDGAGTASAAGYALLGEAEAARDDLAAARAALGKARAMEPGRRRYAVRLAHVLRLGGDASGALAELDAIAAPSPIESDPAYWVERGEALLALGRANVAVTQLAPAAAALGGDVELLTVIGDASLQAGDAPGAVGYLEAAMKASASAPPPTSRTARTLSAALVVVGERAIGGGDLPAAEAALARADQVAGTAAVWRDLGLVRLSDGAPEAAEGLLAKAVAADQDPVSAILLGRARAARGDEAGARAAFDQAAQRAVGPRAIDVAVERASFELAHGQPAAAVDVLAAVPAPLRTMAGAAARLDAALVTARHAAGLALLADGQALKAAAMLDEAERTAEGDQAIAIRCDAALAAVATGDRDRATARLRAIAKLRCPFPAPADTQAVPILTAFVDGLNPKRAAKAADKLEALERSASGVTQQLAATAVRVVSMTAAEQAYRAGKTAAARKFLATAKAAASRAGADELAYDLGVASLADDDLDAARAAFQRVVARVPEAYIGLGIVADREGDGARALDAWRAAKKAGARFAALDEWIAAKERVFGSAAPSAPGAPPAGAAGASGGPTPAPGGTP
ncbi:MAG TPA: tetratricopeptide repeat protein [Kofleriaceae bacterium]|nr:tetratricopeptide repeat protein [Kofleriaceae bacterium]